MIDRDKFIGFESPPVTIDVEKGQLASFAKATGQTDPIYFDEAAARAAGHPGLPAPPTFAFLVTSMARDKVGPDGDAARLMNLNPAHVLHAEQGFEYFKPIYAGDTVTLRSKVTDIYDKKNGALEFIVTTFDLTNQHGDLCVRMNKNLAVRNPGAGK